MQTLQQRLFGIVVNDDEDNSALDTGPPIVSDRTGRDLTNVLTNMTNHPLSRVCIHVVLLSDIARAMNTKRIRICTDNILAAPVRYHDEYRHHRSGAVR